MATATETNERRTILGCVGDWWQKRRKRRAAVAELERCGRAEVESLARDVGISPSELIVLAGKWPDATNLLARRIAALRLDMAGIGRAEPQVVRDLQRVCSLCASKRVCEHDLDRSPGDPGWQEYCPNAQTLEAARR